MTVEQNQHDSVLYLKIIICFSVIPCSVKEDLWIAHSSFQYLIFLSASYTCCKSSSHFVFTYLPSRFTVYIFPCCNCFLQPIAYFPYTLQPLDLLSILKLLKLWTFWTLTVDSGEWQASCPGNFTSGEGIPGTHWIVCWVGPRVTVHVVIKRNFFLCQESNLGSSVVNPIVYSLHWLKLANCMPPFGNERMQCDALLLIVSCFSLQIVTDFLYVVEYDHISREMC